MNTKTKKYYLNLPYNMVIHKLPDNDRYNGEYEAYYKEYPKIIGLGEDEFLAIKDLKSAFECLIEDCLIDGTKIIEPKPIQIKKRVNVIISEDILNSIKKITTNRSAFFENAAKIVMKDKSLLSHCTG